MITARTQRQSPRSKGLLCLMLGLAACAATLVQPASADEYGRHHDFNRQHAVPYRHHESNDHHGWRHHRHHEPYCTTRAVPYWDGFWSQWRTRYVRECW